MAAALTFTPHTLHVCSAARLSSTASPECRRLSTSRPSSWRDVDVTLFSDHDSFICRVSDPLRAQAFDLASASEQKQEEKKPTVKEYLELEFGIHESLLSSDDFTFLRERAQKASAILNGTSIFLVGMMGSGKTTVGRILAQVLGYGFCDSDSVVERLQGTTIPNIFAQFGEKSFRDSETEALADLSLMKGVVVATGGGSVIRPLNWECLRNGVTVWVHAPIPNLAHRITQGGVASRPLLHSGEMDKRKVYNETLARLEKLWDSRHLLYAKADIYVSAKDIALYEECPVSSVPPILVVYQVLNEIILQLKEQPAQ
eukprot:TRINITY_DN13415_c0_g1_i1.p1 TRINITY_DN13415_c0_g1~~TRINITY_DN13415_c0_g1_i1.p1  ORF type:complete len:329 (+),score=37.55 TRINITY_DN13415_c0_g1_i1:44-988(+)